MIRQISSHPAPLAFREIVKKHPDGQLRITGSGFEKTLFFEKGQIVFGQTTVLQERLGEILFKLGKIDQTQFWNLQKLIDGQNAKIGKLLVQNHIIDKKDIFFGLVHQMRTIALSLFRLTEGSWEILPSSKEIDSDLKFQMELTDIIPEGVKKIPTFDPYRKLFGNLTLHVESLTGEPSQKLSPDNRRMLKEISLQAGQPAENLADRLQFPEDILWAKLMYFYLLNLIDFNAGKTEESSEKHEDSKTENREVFTRAAQPQTDYYDLLDVPPSASLDQIKEAYFTLAKKFHPDRLSHTATEEERDAANAVFAKINKAYETLSNETRRKLYDKAGFKDEDPSDEPDESPAEKARRLHRKARGLFNQKKFWEASTLMEEAVRVEPHKGSYLLLLGLCQIYIPDKRRQAETNLQKAAEIEPWNPEPFVALGRLFHSEQMLKRSLAFFQKALSIDPNHAVAKAKLEAISKKTGKKKSFKSIFGRKK